MYYPRWDAPVESWVKRAIVDSPLMILVLDGINERYESSWWRTLIEKLSNSPWFDHVGIIITCRSQYWKENFENLRYLKVQKYELSSYDEEELKRALHYCDLVDSNIIKNLVPLIYKPRYFDLTVKYYQEISESGDVTIARLIYEDWKDRLNRKNHLSLNNTEFQDFIRDLAREKYSDKEEKYIDKDLEFKPKEIEDNLPFKDKKEKIFEDIKTEKIIRKKSNGRYCVDEKFLTYGFGLLLVSELESLHENLLSESKDEKINSRMALEKLGEAIAGWLEPNAGMDIKAEIRQFAYLIALEDADISLQIKISLLSAWINSQNPGLDSDYEFISYLPQDPEPYIHLAPIFWSGNNQNPWGQELLMRGLLKWKDKPNVYEKLTEAIEEWLSLINIYGFPSQRHQIKDLEEIHAEINQRVGFSITENFDFCNYKFIVIADDGWMRLSRFALALISSFSRKSFISAITQGCLAEAIMGNSNKYELFQWVIMTSPESLWEEIRLKANHLLESKKPIAQLAAHRLLSFEGSKEAYEIQQDIPENVLPVNYWRAEYEKDPCRSGISWDRKTCESCLERDDLALHWIAQNLQKHCLDPSLKIPKNLKAELSQLLNHISVESIWSRLQTGSDDHNFNQYESVFCAYSLNELANLVKLVFSNITQRQLSSLHYLQFHICEHYILFDSIQENSIWQAWLQIHQKSLVIIHVCNIKLYQFLSIFKNWLEVDDIAEAFLFKSVLKYLTTDDQINLLLVRPQEATDLLTFENHFKSFELNDGHNEFLSEILKQDNNILQRFLWFIAPFAKNIPTNILNKHIVPLTKNDTSFTRATSLCVIYKSVVI